MVLDLSSDLAAIFENSEFGRQVTHTDETGFQKQVWVVARFGDSLDSQLTASVATFRVRKSDLPDPQPRETFTLDDGSEWEIVHRLTEDAFTIRLQVQSVRGMKVS
jgi:hypothetical protein